MTFTNLSIRGNNLSTESSANKDLILQISTVCVITARKKNLRRHPKIIKNTFKKKITLCVPIISDQKPHQHLLSPHPQRSRKISRTRLRHHSTDLSINVKHFVLNPKCTPVSDRKKSSKKILVHLRANQSAHN